VTATATDADAALLRTLGAAETIGYAGSEYPTDVDVVLNLVVPGDRLAVTARALRPGGRLVTITFPVPQPEWLGRDDVDLRFVLDMDGVHGGMREVALDGLTTTIGGRYSSTTGCGRSSTSSAGTPPASWSSRCEPPRYAPRHVDAAR
jgi:NADPH:quinone reductase-like Zn-dependent oxidoreductase